MVLLPIAVGLAIVALLAILVRERRSGVKAERPLYVTVTAALLVGLVGLYLVTYALNIITAR